MAVAIAVLVFTLFKVTAGAEKQARSFLTATLKGDTARAYADAAPVFRESTNQEQLQGEVDFLKPMQGAKVSNTGRSVSAVSGSPTRAAVSYKLDTAGTTLYVRVLLEKIGGKWKVVGFAHSDQPLSTELK